MAAPVAFVALVQLLSIPATAIHKNSKLTERFGLGVDEKSLKFEEKLGVMSAVGVTRYRSRRLKKIKTTNGKTWWPDSNNRENQDFQGPTDLLDNVSWGWHHPNGVYNTIPVGAPLIDENMSIYVGSDDAIRKFDITGDLQWSYAPRGQLAAAPTLAVKGPARRLARDEDELHGISAAEEELLRPAWADPNSTEFQYSFQFFKNLRIGDMVRVAPGQGYHADGQELYKAGDRGLVSGVVQADEQGGEERAVIEWPRTGHKSVVQLSALKDRFIRVPSPTRLQKALPGMLVGSTTSGYVFALDLVTGEELWATQASDQIAGVKGAVACKIEGNDGVVVAATNRCLDRYCYRYRNQTNALTPGNSVVRGLRAVDGSEIWQIKTFSPVWNMAPLWGKNGTVMFQDYEGRVYCLDYKTGEVKFRVGGDIGTHTQAAATYEPQRNIVYALGVKHYEHKYCNPYPAPGILPHCNTWPGSAGFIRAYSAATGRRMWHLDTAEPPSGGAIGRLNSPRGHNRLVVAMGYNCKHNSPSQLWSIDPVRGNIRWIRQGPTLWGNMCAGDKEGGDIRRAMGGRAACVPNSWSVPAIDSEGDVYIGSQVGELQRWGSPTGKTGDVQMLSSMSTSTAFQDVAVAFGPGIMAVTTCTSLIVFGTSADAQFPLP